jgi:hypothetical protein
MKHIRIIAAAAATAVALAFAFSPAASAKSCEDGEAACVSSPQQASPMKLDQFMTTWKPVSVSKHGKKSKAARKKSPTHETVAESRPAAESSPVAAETPPPAQAASMITPPAAPTSETDGVAVTSFDEPNELDAAADHVQVMAFNEINEIDLAAPPPPMPVETTGQVISTQDRTPVDNSWIGKLLLAAAGTIAIAGATRFMVA